MAKARASKELIPPYAPVFYSLMAMADHNRIRRTILQQVQAASVGASHARKPSGSPA